MSVAFLIVKEHVLHDRRCQFLSSQGFYPPPPKKKQSRIASLNYARLVYLIDSFSCKLLSVSCQLIKRASCHGESPESATTNGEGMCLLVCPCLLVTCSAQCDIISRDCRNLNKRSWSFSWNQWVMESISHNMRGVEILQWNLKYFVKQFLKCVASKAPLVSHLNRRSWGWFF